MRTYILTLLFLIANTLSFAEIPHSYVTENPKKEVQKVETFKQRDKAELNLSVTKIKTKDLLGRKGPNGEIEITLNEELIKNNFIITENEAFKPIQLYNKKTQILEKEVKNNRVLFKSNNENIYVNVLNENGSIKNLYKVTLVKATLPHRSYGTSYIYVEVDKTYDGSTFKRKGGDWNRNPVYGTDSGRGIRTVSYQRFENGYAPLIYRGSGTVWEGAYAFASLGYASIDDIRFYTAGGGSQPAGWNYSLHDGNNYRTCWNVKIREDLYASVWIDGIRDEYGVRLNKFPEKNFEFKVYHYGLNWFNGQAHSVDFTTVFKFIYVPETLKGNSTLTFGEYYPVNEFIQFSTSTLDDKKPLKLENNVKDVTLNTTGQGMLLMEAGDKLTVDNNEIIVGAGGNVAPQKLEIGNLKYTYEVKNGKFRIALNEWGVLEPDRTIKINILQTEGEIKKAQSTHNLTLKAPRKVAGTSGVKLNQDYNLGDFVRFNGISLQGAGALGLENPIPLGVSLTSTAGQGIPFMKEGDILEISDDLTKAVKTFTVGPNGNLPKQQVSLKSGDIIVYTEAGKLRVSAINWVLNKPIKMNLGLIKGTNKVMDHSLEIQVPDAPFKVTKKGILDFGNVTSGTKRTAETNIGIEMMINGVEIVEFKLKDPNPTMENLTTGDTLAVNKIEYLVIKKDDKKYDIRLKGNLTIPEGTKSGLYTGSTTMQLRLR